MHGFKNNKGIMLFARALYDIASAKWMSEIAGKGLAFAVGLF